MPTETNTALADARALLQSLETGGDAVIARDEARLQTLRERNAALALSTERDRSRLRELVDFTERLKQ